MFLKMVAPSLKVSTVLRPVVPLSSVSLLKTHTKLYPAHAEIILVSKN